LRYEIERTYHEISAKFPLTRLTRNSSSSCLGVQLSDQTKNSSFGPFISNQIATNVPRFIKYLRDAKSSLKKSASSEMLGSPEFLQQAKDPEYVKLARCAIQAAVILHRCDLRVAPKNLVSQLPQLLNQLITDLDSSLFNATGVSPLQEMSLGDDDSPSGEVVPSAARAAVKYVILV
jgi:hypothetical protein